MALATPAAAQTATDDAAAREYFNAGRVAFKQADYESALVYFQHAYRTSGRNALLYNIGVAADRLHREQEALEAFELYLATTENPARESEVRARIEALRKSIAEREANSRALTDAALHYGQDRRARKRDTAPVPSAASLGTTDPRSGAVSFQMPKYADRVDQPTAKKKKKWPWIVAAAAVVVVGGVTAGVVVSQRSKQSQPSSGGFTVNW
jgi:tetratricopeptide (TPR) repeat protein